MDVPETIVTKIAYTRKKQKMTVSKERKMIYLSLPKRVNLCIRYGEQLIQAFQSHQRPKEREEFSSRLLKEIIQ
jgi:hypothetical protein